MPDVTGDWSRTDETDKETGYGPLHEAMYPELYKPKKKQRRKNGKVQRKNRNTR